MPFGANLLGDGRASLALWAPDAESVDLILQGETVPMSGNEGGLFEAET